jgi:hypothetical protein
MGFTQNCGSPIWTEGGTHGVGAMRLLHRRILDLDVEIGRLKEPYKRR